MSVALPVSPSCTQTHVESWRDMVEEFSITLKHREEEMRQQLRQLAPGIDWWLKELRKCL